MRGRFVCFVGGGVSASEKGVESLLDQEDLLEPEDLLVDAPTELGTLGGGLFMSVLDTGGLMLPGILSLPGLTSCSHIGNHLPC